MKKLLLLLLPILLFAIDDVTKPHTFFPDSTIFSSRINANYDTLYNDRNRLGDTLEIAFIRFSDLENRDSTLDSLNATYINVTTIEGLDTIINDIHTGIDSLFSQYIQVPTINNLDTIINDIHTGIDSLFAQYIQISTILNATLT